MTHATAAADDDRTAARLRTVVLACVLGVIGLALAVAVGLWMHYGTTVFFQVLAAGIAACF
ncbi:hypothetical protein JQ557_23795 [Bradyrhizobium sp. U87765 SZCCT0131]|uniref:hypothetical protein n=1 Tax=unclassified Bradyrhizobium TaxID=2631580 RepID=UPI001BADB7E0|nr:MULTISPECIES: hypothetical protein [unclassified Bradyrhizobium]MBR1221042.1 hypothetical protein [Bradyrhizobium sp. U87765 SZCCT0131]MBR1260138.1 hypothetical protein [Bradyrhizobium sp. U87765 SZCCT0134]MBR1307613.1 hypothetical protein [Bradyrhizobium sp. U87765 SZCCT0110]MBR1321567.1 hypothetical protein [Bradyrhizobium sp. U87765 SZCCT0109]MBR1349880.1 hypothetical protein [Bradyrhizobium sp. U87765 SZCCT0048]